MRDDGAERFSRWARGPDGALTVFLNAPVSGTQQLSLRGRLPVKPGDMPLPLVRVEADETKEFAVRLYRDSAVQLELTSMEGLMAVQSPVVEEGKARLGRLVKELRTEARASSSPSAAVDPKGVVSAKLRLLSNRPRVQGEQVTSLRVVEESWEAEADLHLAISDGVVDEFRVEAPPEWPGPYKTQPPAVVRVVHTGKDRRQLLVRPQAAMEKECRFRIGGPLALAPGDRPTLPHIVFEQAEVTQHLVIVPIPPSSQSLVWEVGGLIPAPLPDDFPTATGARASLACYRVVREPFRAVLSPQGRISGVPQVLLADIGVAWQGDGHFYGRAAYDVEPAGMAQCPLNLPPEVRLVHTEVEGLPAMPIPNGESRWQIPLAPGKLPQRLEVLFEGRMAIAGARPRCSFRRLDWGNCRSSKRSGRSRVPQSTGRSDRTAAAP